MPHLTPQNLYPSWMTNWGNDWRAYGLVDGNLGSWWVTLYNWDLVSKWFGDIRPNHLLTIEGAIAYTSYPPRLDLLKSTMNMWAMTSAQRITDGVSPEAAQYFTNAEVNAILEDVGPAFLLSQTTNSGSLCDEWLKPLRNGSKAIMFLNRAKNAVEFTVASTNLNLGTTNVIGFRDPWIGSYVSTNAVWRITVDPESTALFVAVPGPIRLFRRPINFFFPIFR